MVTPIAKKRLKRNTAAHPTLSHQGRGRKTTTPTTESLQRSRFSGCPMQDCGV